MLENLMKNKLIYEAIFEYDDLYDAQEKILHRNKEIQKNKHIDKSVKDSIKEKTSRILQLITILLDNPTLTIEERELLYHAACTYNYQISFLLHKKKKWLRFLYKGFCKENYAIAEALGYRMTGTSYIARNLELLLAIMIAFVILFDLLMVLLWLSTDSWILPLIFGGAVTAVMGKFIYPLAKNKQLLAVAESCRARLSHFDIKNNDKFKEDLDKGLQQSETIKDIFSLL